MPAVEISSDEDYEIAAHYSHSHGTIIYYFCFKVRLLWRETKICYLPSNSRQLIHATFNSRDS